MRRWFFFVPITVYLVSLALPGLVTEPQLSNNPKYFYCDQLQNWTGQPIPASLDDVVAYCGSDWNKPVASPVAGWFILAFGYFAGYGDADWIGIVAWSANGIAFFVLFLLLLKEYRVSVVASLGAILIGLTSFAYHTMPANEGGVYGTPISRPAIGFYVWEASFILLLFHAIVLLRDARKMPR